MAENYEVKTPTVKDWYELVPKIELHLHLEGAIPHVALWQLAQKYGGDPNISDIATLERQFQYRDFPHFIEAWIWKNSFLREYEDFSFLAAAVARDLAAQQVRYAEVFYSPADFAHHGLQIQDLTVAIRQGLAQVPEIEIALIADLVRDGGAQNGAVRLAAVNEVREYGVIGIGIGGSEQNFPPEEFAPVYSRARELGFHTTAHAGEVAGAQSVWGALRALQVERIGHGVRSIEDEQLLDYLVEHQIPLEVCPISNVCTRVVPTIEAHPVRRLFERGVFVTINTDDPKMFGNSLAGEYRILVEKLGFSQAEIRQLILQALRASWLPTTRQQKLIADFCSSPNW